MERSSEEILKDIYEQLSWDSRVDHSQVRVEIADHKVVLSGSVASYSESKAIEEDVWMLDGVRSVDNRIKVMRREGLIKPSDDEIKWNIKTILTLNQTINTGAIELIVTKGIVLVSGSVDELWKKIKIEETILEVPGVYDIVNTLTVVPTRAPFDENIAADIQAALSRISGVELDKVVVEVSGGKVTLRGRVQNWAAYSSAFAAARYTKGVVDVENELMIV